jgi:hypothetical protein
MRLQQGLLLCVLALAVLGMHHLALAPHQMSCHQPAAPSSGPAGSTASGSSVVIASPSIQSSDGPATGTGHDLMHLCLAILSTGAWLFLLAWLSTAFGDGGLDAVRLRVPATRARRRRRSTGRSLLTSVCVLRI